MQAPKYWAGSESVNLFKVICDMLDLLQEMNLQLATHTQLPGPTPTQADASAFQAKATTVLQLSMKLRSFTR